MASVDAAAGAEYLARHVRNGLADLAVAVGSVSGLGADADLEQLITTIPSAVAQLYPRPAIRVSSHRGRLAKIVTGVGISDLTGRGCRCYGSDIAVLAGSRHAGARSGHRLTGSKRCSRASDGHIPIIAHGDVRERSRTRIGYDVGPRDRAADCDCGPGRLIRVLTVR